MNVSDEGLKFIAGHEGMRTKPYNDPSGFCTVGIGHLIGRRRCTQADYSKWGELSEAEVLELFREDIKRFEGPVAEAVTVPLNQAQFDALVSFAFNVGIGDAAQGVGFKGSTLLKKLNAGDYEGAAAEFPKWRWSNGQVHAGLVRRRAEERAMFERAEVVLRPPMVRPSGEWSLEIEHGIRYLDATGVPHRITSTFRGRGTSSRHDQQGTKGPGLALDAAGTAPGWDTPELLAIFEAFVPVEDQLYELIYSGAPYSIKRGKRVNRYAIADHWNHVHVAFYKGVFLELPGGGPALPDMEEEEEDMAPRYLFHVTSKDKTLSGVWEMGSDEVARHVPVPTDISCLKQAGARDAGEMSEHWLLRHERVHPGVKGSMP